MSLRRPPRARTARSTSAALASMAAETSTPISRAFGNRPRRAGNRAPAPQPRSTTLSASLQRHAGQQVERRPQPWRRRGGHRARATRSSVIASAAPVPGGASAAAWRARSVLQVEVGDQLHEQPVPVHLRAEMHEHGAEPDRGTVHEHELARRGHAADLAQLLVHALDHLAALLAAVGLLDRRATGSRAAARRGRRPTR